MVLPPWTAIPLSVGITRNWRTEQKGNTQKSSGQQLIFLRPSRRIAILSIQRRFHLLQPQGYRSLILAAGHIHRLSLHPPAACVPCESGPSRAQASITAAESRPHPSSAPTYPVEHRLQRARPPRTGNPHSLSPFAHGTPHFVSPPTHLGAHLLPGTQRELGPRQLSLIPPRPLSETHLWSFPSVSEPSTTLKLIVSLFPNTQVAGSIRRPFFILLTILPHV